MFFSLTTLLIQPATTKETFFTPDFGKIIVSVIDKHSSKPIQNATICITNTREYFFTNKLGMTHPIKLITTVDSTYTLLIYSNGYYPHIYYGLTVVKNSTKTGIVIMLEEVYPESNITYTESYEFPSKTQANQLIKEYKK